MEDLPQKGADQPPVVDDEFEAAIEAAAGEAEPEPDDDEQDAEDDEPETPKPESKPNDEPPADAPDPDPTDSELVLAKVTEVLEAIKKRNAEAEHEADEEPEADEVPERFRLLMEHDDPAVRESGKVMFEEHKATNERIAAIETKITRREVDEISAALDKHIETVSASNFNPPLTVAEQAAIVNRMTDETKGPALARSLDFQDVAKMTFPARWKDQAPPKTDTPPKGGEGKRPVVKSPESRPDKAPVFDRGGAEGRSPAVRREGSDTSLDATIDRVFTEAGLG